MPNPFFVHSFLSTFLSFHTRSLLSFFFVLEAFGMLHHAPVAVFKTT